MAYINDIWVSNSGSLWQYGNVLKYNPNESAI